MANFNNTSIEGNLTVKGNSPSTLYVHIISLTASNITGKGTIFIYSPNSAPLTFDDVRAYFYGYANPCRYPVMFRGNMVTEQTWTTYSGFISAISTTSITVRYYTKVSSTTTHTYTASTDTVYPVK